MQCKRKCTKSLVPGHAHEEKIPGYIWLFTFHSKAKSAAIENPLILIPASKIPVFLPLG